MHKGWIKRGGGREVKILVKEATKKGYAEATEGDSINFGIPDSKTRRGRVGRQSCNTLCTTCDQAIIGGRQEGSTIVRLRKVIPKECFRLQGWPDEYFERAEQFNSDSQLYKQAGNGVTVNVIYAIASQALTTQTDDYGQFE